MSGELRFNGDPSGDSGLTLTASLYGSDGVLHTASITLTEIGSTAIYKGDMPTAVADCYTFRVLSGSSLLGDGEITWDGDAEVTLLTLRRLIGNKKVADTGDGKEKIYLEDGSTVAYEGQAWEDVAGTAALSPSSVRVLRRERLEAP